MLNNYNIKIEITKMKYNLPYQIVAIVLLISFAHANT